MSRGRFVWHELLTTDTRAARRFYRAVVRWRTMKWDADPAYVLLTNSAGPVAGLLALPGDALRAGAPPSWLTYVSTSDVDATVQQAMALGARVLTGPLDVRGVGRIAVVADPQGAVFAPLRGDVAPPSPLDAPPHPGEFTWHELTTVDGQAAFRFYSALFGWTKTETLPIPGGGLYEMFGIDGHSIGGVYTTPPAAPAVPQWLCYAHVVDIHQALEAVRSGGGRIVSGPIEVPGGDHVAQCVDPQGAAFALHALPRVRLAEPPTPAKARRARKRRAPRGRGTSGRPSTRTKKQLASKKQQTAPKKKTKKGSKPRKRPH